MSLSNFYQILVASTIISTTLVSNAASAQNDLAGQRGESSANGSSAGAVGLSEIVVTANKRSENLQKAAAAISVVGGDLIANTGLVDATQLQKLVPSLVLGKQGPNSVVFLRGVGQTNSGPNAQPGISMNVDGFYFPRDLGGATLFDLERVEVLPGPQGTLYGRNSAGGAINLVTRKPGSEFSAEGWAEVGNYSLIHVFTGVDVPVTDGISIRGAFDVNKRDGYLTNGNNDQDRSLEG